MDKSMTAEYEGFIAGIKYGETLSAIEIIQIRNTNDDEKKTLLARVFEAEERRRLWFLAWFVTAAILVALLWLIA